MGELLEDSTIDIYKPTMKPTVKLYENYELLLKSGTSHNTF